MREASIFGVPGHHYPVPKLQEVRHEEIILGDKGCDFPRLAAPASGSQITRREIRGRQELLISREPRNPYPVPKLQEGIPEEIMMGEKNCMVISRDPQHNYQFFSANLEPPTVSCFGNNMHMYICVCFDMYAYIHIHIYILYVCMYGRVCVCVSVLVCRTHLELRTMCIALIGGRQKNFLISGLVELMQI